eukprot:2647495-Prymnesium_polylepis.1
MPLPAVVVAAVCATTPAPGRFAAPVPLATQCRHAVPPRSVAVHHTIRSCFHGLFITGTPQVTHREVCNLCHVLGKSMLG